MESPKREVDLFESGFENFDFDDLDLPVEDDSGWKVPPILGSVELNRHLREAENLQTTRIQTEVFSDTIREHKTITRSEVMKKHGSTLSKIGRLSKCNDQYSLLPAVLQIREEEYRVLDRECKDRLGMFFKAYLPERSAWTAMTGEKMTYDYYKDETRELSRPIPEELTLLPSRLQRVADFLKEPDITGYEMSLVSKLVQTEANRASELVEIACNLLQPSLTETEGVGLMDKRAYQSLQESQKQVDQTAILLGRQLEQMKNQEEHYKRLINETARKWRNSADEVTDRLSSVADRVKSAVDMADRDHYRLLIELENTCSGRAKETEKLTEVMGTMNKVLQERTPESTPIKKRLRSATSASSEVEFEDLEDFLATKRPRKHSKA